MKDKRKAGSQPEFLSKLSAGNGPVGGSATLSCRVDGKPLPEVRWFRNGMPLHPSSRVKAKVSDDGLATLTIDDLGPEDAGEITCQVVNNLGKESCSAPLTVDGE